MAKENLQKSIGFTAALSTVIGMVIGGGVFFKPQAVYELTGGAPGLGLLAWFIAGVMTITAGLTAAEISAAIPKSGGMMVYIEEVYGKKLGFLTGWMQTVLFFPATIAAVSVMFGEQLSLLIGSPGIKIPMTIGVILVIVYINTFGSESSGKIQTAATFGKLVPLAVLIIFGFVLGSGDNSLTTPMVGEGVKASGVIGQLLVAILFTYDGWINVGAIAGEMKDPARDLPKSIIAGLTITMGVYLLINVAYLWVLPANELMLHSSPASAVAEAMFGPFGGKLVTIGILVSVFGCINGYVLTGSRTIHALAHKGLLPAKLDELNKNGVPQNTTIFLGLLSIVYALSGQFNLLTDLSMFVIWSLYVLTFVAVIKLRKTAPNMHRPYKVPFYPIVPLIAITSGSFVVINQLLFAGTRSTIMSVGGIIITLLGLPVYNHYSKKLDENKEAQKAA